MKKLLLLSMLLFLFTIAFADTYVIGTGTTASGLYPIYGYYDYSWSKQIYTAAEINAAGLNEVASITGIGLYVGNTPANFVMADQRIYIRHSTLTGFTTVTDETGSGYPANSGFSQVFQGTLTFNGGGWHYITFDNPFAWNNTDGLEILWENWCLLGVTGYPTFRYTSTSPDYKNVYKYQDGSFPAVAGTRSISRPNITIVTPQLDPPNPAILVYPGNGSYSFMDGVLSWADGGGMPDGYDVYLDTVDGTTLVSDNQPGTSYTPTLAAGTTYYWKVVPYNINGPAVGVTTWSFKTPTATQIAESFDAVDFPPLGWTTPGGAFTRSTTTPFYGTAGAYEYISSSTTDPSYLYTSMLELTSTSELDWWMRTSYTYGNGRVQIVYSSDGITWNNIGAEIIMPTETTWMNYNVGLSSLAGNNYMIGFKVYNYDTSNVSNYYIDHVFGPELAALAPDPATLIYPTDAGWAFLDGVLQWNPPTSGGIPDGYDVYLDTVDGSTLVSDNQLETTYVPTLAAGTTYYWKVVPYNSSGSAAGCPVWSFTTPTATQIAESFDDTTFPPLGWTNVGSAFIRSTVTPFHGVASAYEYISTGPSILYTPMLAIDANSELDWWMRTTSTTGIGRVQINYSTDGVTWSPVGAEIIMPTETTWQNYNVDLSTITAGNYFISFHVYSSTTTSTSFYIDHVFGPEYAAIAPGPVTLSAPADLAVDQNPLPTLTWTFPATGGMPTGYKIYLDTNTTPTTLIGTVTDPATLSFAVTSALNWSTTYYWTVVAYNGGGDGTGPTPYSFTTMADPTIYTFPWLEDFGTDGSPFPPTNWSLYSGLMVDPIELTTATSYWYQDDFANVVTAPSNESGKINIYSTSRKGWMVSPPIQMPGTGYQLEFDIALTDYANSNPITSDPNGTTGIDDRFAVLIGDGVTWTVANAIGIWDNDDLTSGGIYGVYNDISNTGDHKVYSLDAYTGVKYIAFYGESTVSNADNDFFVDNVRIRLGGQAPEHVTLVAPADLATDVSSFETTLQWTNAVGGGAPSYYEVYVGASPIDPGNDYYGEYFYETTSTSLNLSEQADIVVGFANTWYWAVLPYNDFGNPDPAGMTVYRFTTLPDPTIIALPYAEYFDSVTAPTLPYGWSSYVNSTSTYAVVATYSSTTYAETPPNSVRLYNSTDAMADLRLITPMIDATIPLNTIKLKFYARGLATGDNVLIGTVDVPDGTGVFTLIDSLALTTTRTEYNYSLDSYVGTDQYICFKLGTGETYNYAYIDNVQLIEILANDLAATELDAPPYAIQGSPVDFDITVFNEGTATQTEYTVKLYDEFDTELASLPVTYTLDPLAYATHTFSWTPATTGVFNVYGKVVLTGDQNAANDATATWPVTVVTSTTYLPWSEYFDLVTPPAMPQGWTAIKIATSTSAYADTYASTTYSVSAPNCARLANSSDAAADLRLVLPEILLPVNSVRMSFYARGSSSGYTLLVGTMDARDGVFTQYASINLTSTQTQYNVEFNAYTGTDTYIAFKHGLGGTYRTLYLDNVELTEIFNNDLAAQSFTIPNYGYVGSSYDFTFDVKNVGLLTQSSYDVKLINAAGDVELATQTITTAIDPGATVQHTLQWTPAVEGLYNIYGKVVLTGDQGPANDATATKVFYVLPADIDILTVGDPETTTSVNYLPTNVYYKNGVTEELYFQDETHLLSGDILALVYKNNFTQQLDGLAFKIWMGTTTATDLTGGWLPADSLHLVFDGTLDLPIGVNEVIIPLQTPFAYNGDNLFVRWNRVMDTVYYNSTNTWYYNNTSTTHPSRSRYLQSDATLYNPLAPEAAGTISSYVPLTWLVVDNAVIAPQAILSGHVYEFGTTTPIEGALITLTERATALTDQFGYYEFIYWDSTYVDLTASKTNYYSSTVTDISFEPGIPAIQDFYLTPYPQITFSGMVTSNDYPTGLEGATVKLLGYANYETTTGAGGTFSIPGVYGTVDGLIYTVTASKDGYQSFSGEMTAYSADLNYGTINLIEYLWTPYNLVATHEGDNARLVWDPAAAPDYYFTDFETDNGGWVGSGYGDWEWTNTYNVALYNPSGSTYTQTPPDLAYSGTGMWGTIMYGPYSNSGAFSYLTQTFDLSGFDTPQLRFWRWNNLNGTYDYYQVIVNGTVVFTENVVNNTWMEKVVDLTAYAGMSSVEIQFAEFASTVVNYAGLYIDDIYIGNPPARTAEGERWFLYYDVYRFLAADEGNPGVWTQLQSGVADTTYLDTGFSALPGGTYEWAIKAVYSGDEQSEAIISNTLGIVATPLNITATKVGANVQLDWTADPGAGFYRIYGSDDPYTGFVFIGYSTTNTYTITAPADMKKFYYVTAGADEDPVPPAPPAIRK